MAKSHEYMVQILQTLSTNVDNKGLDKLVNLKKTINRNDRSKLKKVIEIKYSFFLESSTEKVVGPSTQANIVKG